MSRRIQLDDQQPRDPRANFEGEDEPLDPEEVQHAAVAAIHTLIQLGYHWDGGTLWKPPLGVSPFSQPSGYALYCRDQGAQDWVIQGFYRKRENAVEDLRRYTPGTEAEIRPVYERATGQPVLTTTVGAAPTTEARSLPETIICPACRVTNRFRSTCGYCGTILS